MNNEMEIETLETNLKEAKRIGEFNWLIGELVRWQIGELVRWLIDVFV